MYSVKPLGLNTRSTDRDIKDGSLKESLNLQWRDGTFRPIPERLISTIDTTGYSNIILHKVADENQINVLGFQTGSVDISGDLAFDLAGYLGGAAAPQTGYLTWFGTITDGVYAAITPVLIPEVVNTDGMTFTILNGLVYFMGDGSDADEQYYIRLQYNETSEEYVIKDMYAWKSLIPFYPQQDYITVSIPSKTNNVYSICGVVCVRFTLVLKSGEEVLHSPIYTYRLEGLNASDDTIEKGALIENINAFINLNLEFTDSVLFKEEISAINVYSSIPYYEAEMLDDPLASKYTISSHIRSGEAQRLAETPFYLVRTIESADSDEKLLLTVGGVTPELEYNASDVAIIDLATVAAGSVMPVDNFTYHKIFGSITSFNGRLIIEKPVTVLSAGSLRSLAVEDDIGRETYSIDTEDGNFNGLITESAKRVEIYVSDGNKMMTRGIISYPDSRASHVTFGHAAIIFNFLWKVKTRANKLHNMACALEMKLISPVQNPVTAGGKFTVLSTYMSLPEYSISEIESPLVNRTNLYSSENRFQFSAPGEFSVWLAINSYRVGEGKIMRIGANSVDPANADVIATLIVGTSDGVYSVNLDPTGSNLVSSITKTANQPYISKEVLEIDGTLVYVSDKGLIATRNGDPGVNLTADFFPDQGNGNFPVNETVFPNYNLLTTDYFGGSGNPYVLDDVVDYMKGALLAYDARRKNIWCCNPTKTYSLVFNITNKMWGTSTILFTEKTELFSILDTSVGDIYSRFMIKAPGEDNLLILSGEDMDTEVVIHLLTRPIKIKYPENYKKLKGLSSRCELFRDAGETGYFSFGAWGKQDHNKNKKGIPITAKSDNRAVVYPGNVRQDIPVGCHKGKYKSVVILQGGLTLPDSSIDSFDFDAVLVDKLRTR